DTRLDQHLLESRFGHDCPRCMCNTFKDLNRCPGGREKANRTHHRNALETLLRCCRKLGRRNETLGTGHREDPHFAGPVEFDHLPDPPLPTYTDLTPPLAIA